MPRAKAAWGRKISPPSATEPFPSVTIEGVAYKPQISLRLREVQQHLGARKGIKVKFDKPLNDFRHLKGLYSYVTPRIGDQERHPVNKLVSDVANVMWGWDTVNSAVGHTQSNRRAVLES